MPSAAKLLAEIKLNLTPMQRLTPQQLSVIKSAALGCGGQETADALGISLKTVKFHKTRIYKKLNVKSIVQAVLAVGLEAKVATDTIAMSELRIENAKLQGQLAKLQRQLKSEQYNCEQYRTALLNIQSGFKSSFTALPSASVAKFSDKLNGVAK